MGDTLEATKLAPNLPSTGLHACPIPEPFKSAVTGIPSAVLQIIAIVEAAKGNADNAKELALYIGQVTDATIRPLQNLLLDFTHQPLKEGLDQFSQTLELVQNQIRDLLSRSRARRLLRYSSDASKIATMKQKIQDAITSIRLETNFTTTYAVAQIAQNQEAANIDRLIDRLGTGDNGASKKPPCLKGTRRAVLARIRKWIEDDDWNGFCLSGQAGTGKSSIAASIAEREKAFNRLGARFHFTRDDQARNKAAILVIARQLASWQSGQLRSLIASAIEKDPDIALMAPVDQFQKLILGPLESLEDTSPTLIVILDALDECDPAYAKLLQLIGKAFGTLSSKVKFFITSRAEPWLQKHYDSELMKPQLVVYSLGDENRESVDKDIEAFLKEELPELVSSSVRDASDWPGEAKRMALVRKSQGLFIFASTAVRIITDSNLERNPNAALKRILASVTHSHLDGIYRQIIERACPSTLNPETIALFQQVLGALVVAREPINVRTLASLLCPDSIQLQDFISDVRLHVLMYLQAVLVIPDVNTIDQTADAQPIRFLHTSFIDYLTDKSRSHPQLLVHLPKQHGNMATVCFRMLQALRRNICDLDSNLLNSEVKDLGERIRERIPPALQYACMHIAAHVAHTAVSSADIHSLVGRFARESLMYWLESLSLMGRAHEAVGMVALIEAWLKTSLTGTTPAHSSSLSSTTKHIKPDDLALTLLYDLRRFVMEFMEPIVTSTCHIYLTGILLMPSETGLSRQYRHLGESGIRVVRGYARQWPQALWTASKHSSAITCVAVSPDGTTIVSGSYDHTLHLWDAKTGAAIGEAMKGHTNSVSCVAVSPDGTTIVSGSYGHTLHLWDAKTGAAIGKATDSHVS